MNAQNQESWNGKYKEIIILLNSVDKVESFVSVAVKFDMEIDLISDGYVINGKSIMGIFSMDLSKPILLRVHGDEKKTEEVIKVFYKYAAV